VWWGTTDARHIYALYIKVYADVLKELYTYKEEEMVKSEREE